ncbi:hypothetical protein BB560_004341 [Smittium megazygosporum]|uniref:Uncharacterized protein n=1 Tax=Smittium megazygosporum TaxID=133381 RepID=A0A2T9Z9K3_9FUNG|nr:hypothetical protein BB560_004341 [Smittium megazygosporum]
MDNILQKRDHDDLNRYELETRIKSRISICFEEFKKITSNQFTLFAEINEEIKHRDKYDIVDYNKLKNFINAVKRGDAVVTKCADDLLDQFTRAVDDSEENKYSDWARVVGGRISQGVNVIKDFILTKYMIYDIISYPASNYKEAIQSLVVCINERFPPFILSGGIETIIDGW